MSEPTFVMLHGGAVWHISAGTIRSDRLWPEPQALCGVVLQESTSTTSTARPGDFGMCIRCLASEKALHKNKGER